MKKIDRASNPADMLTHAPSAAEVVNFRELLGIFPLTCSQGAIEIVKTVLKENPRKSTCIASMLLRLNADLL